MQPTFRLRLKPLCLLTLSALHAYAHAADPADPAPDPAGAPPMAIVEVTGTGQSRQVQNITRADLQQAAPGTSPLKTLEKLPGVSFQSSDPFGSYEWSTRFSIRGFNQNQLGFTLDDVPLGDMSYGNNNGLHISRAISSENIGRVAVSQGAGALGTASTSNLGGTVQFITLGPANEQALSAAQTLGSDDTSRTFIRFDSGRFANGTKFYVSGTRMRAEKWKGAGPQDQDQFNSKIEQPIGDHVLSAFFNYSDRREVDYQDLSLESARRLGMDWDNYYPDWQRAVNAAKGIYSGAVNNMDDAYYLGQGLRKDKLGGATLDLNLGTALTAKLTAYHHGNEGQGHWYTPYTPTSAAVPISIRTTEYTISRNGALADVTWDIGMHTLNAGVWVERNKHELIRNFYAVTDGSYHNDFLHNPMETGFRQSFVTDTRQFYVQDTLALLDGRLKVNAGFKSPKVDIDARTWSGDRADGSITAKKTFLPQVGVTYQLSQNDELFASGAKNMRSYQPGVNGPFSQTRAGYALSIANLKPETSNTFDLGMRFKRNAVQGSVAVYYADFKDRQLGIATCAGIVGCAGTVVNVGKVATRGIEALAVWKIAPSLSWFNTATYNDSQYKSNYTDNGKLVATDGKQVVDAPKKMFNTELAYDANGYFARLGAKYTDKRYYTYLNDASVPSYWLANLAAGYKFGAVAMLKDVTFQVNVTNLFDKSYFGSIGTNGFSTSDPQGTSVTLQNGAPRQVFFTVSGKL
ncbi:iron complex outermembrane receptor protein [Pseudoduganella flava]|uniref:Iron complex outermembrane receptor protein n=1 Tax=Pseudoduganella flava TaxID=871742 RepID=A0A562PZN4_9BURK|nr:TonB-dependent receptor [Pseudoduganella flava]QGZ38578.1 TonB-dependent receptor [Pseudoduganella flava]TWI49858.1 iron complex outermembrane receptor protein [Pseudoduganella flava]